MTIRSSLMITTKRDFDGDEFLSAQLIKEINGDTFFAEGDCRLPELSKTLEGSDMTVGTFLSAFQDGESTLLGVAAKSYGRLLHQALFPAGKELGREWERLCESAKVEGLRLEIRLEKQARWNGKPLAGIPFELLADEDGFLFKNLRWRTVRAIRNMPSRTPRLRWEGKLPTVLLAYANVQSHHGQALPESDFRAHEEAGIQLGQSGRANCADPVRHASRKDLSKAMAANRPDILIWIGHGVEDGSELVLHDGQNPDYPADMGLHVTASDFARDIREGGVDLAILWSCHGAGAARAFDIGVAEALLDPTRGDLAAVVASYSALNSAAVADFSGCMIDAWVADPNGDIEHALARARSGLDEQSLLWARPVLLSRAPKNASSYQFDAPSAFPATTLAHSPKLHWLPELPFSANHLIGRNDLFALIEEDVRRHRMVILEGLPGVGKTKMALTLAQRWRIEGEDVAFVDVSAFPDYGNLMARLGQWLGLEKVVSEAVLIDASRNVKLLLVVDNAQDMMASTIMWQRMLGLLKGLSDASPDFRCLITSRRSPSLENNWLRKHEVRPLDLASSKQLFIACAGPRLPEPYWASAQLDHLLTEIGGIPQTIILVARKLNEHVNLMTMVKMLRQADDGTLETDSLFGVETQSLELTKLKNRLLAALRIVCATAELENSGCATLFDLLGAFPGGLAQDLLPPDASSWQDDNLRATVVDLALPSIIEQPLVADALAVLLQHHLVILVGDERRLLLAAPIRRYAAQRMAQRKNDAAFNRLVGGVYSRLAARAHYMQGLLGSKRTASAYCWMLAEESNLLAALDWFTSSDETLGGEIFALIAHAMSQSMMLGDRIHDALAHLSPHFEYALKMWPQSRAAVVCLRALGELHMRVGNLEAARDLITQALPISRVIQDQLGEANILRALGDLEEREDNSDAARSAYLQALPLFRLCSDTRGEAIVCGSLGNIARVKGAFSEARQHFEMALMGHSLTMSDLGQANTLLELGLLNIAVGGFDDARHCFEDALTFARNLGTRLPEANAQMGLGDIFRYETKLPHALKTYEQALNIFREIQEPVGEANVLQSIGICYAMQGNLNPAFQNLVSAVQIQKSNKSRRDVAASQLYLARVVADAGNPYQAIALTAQALATFRDLDDQPGLKMVYGDLERWILLIHPRISKNIALVAHYLQIQAAKAEQNQNAASMEANFLARLGNNKEPDQLAKILSWLEHEGQASLDEELAWFYEAVQAGQIKLYEPPRMRDE